MIRVDAGIWKPGEGGDEDGDIWPGFVEVDRSDVNEIRVAFKLPDFESTAYVSLFGAGALSAAFRGEAGDDGDAT